MSIQKQVSSHLTPNRNSIGIDQYDHAISLIDTVQASSTPTGPENSDREQGSSRNSLAAGLSSGENTPASRILSRSGLNQELSRRKYARFQEQNYSHEEDSTDVKSKGKRKAVLKSLDDKRGRALERLHIRPKKAGKTKDVQSAIDILYENQRGLFFFGYPLYSSRSLLNFDPGAWTNAEFQDSAVDIRNAQVPDPTWMWSWKRWYVDMSGDVDEQGWQYSLTFGKKFSWHGTHPWFHSAVRRRRWLRTRIKIQHAHHTADAHDMAQDYFTIHPTTKHRSRGSSIASKTIDKSSRLPGRSEPVQKNEDEEDIDNIVALMHVMKNTTVDRKKLDAFKSFVEYGGDEIQLLPEVLPELLKLLFYQISSRQLLDILEEAEQNVDKDKSAKPETSKTKMVALRSTIKLIRENLSRVEYYSDAKAMRREIDNDATGKVEFQDKSKAQYKLEGVKPSKEPSNDVNVETTRVSFRGIPKSAELDVTPGIVRPQGTANTENKE